MSVSTNKLTDMSFQLLQLTLGECVLEICDVIRSTVSSKITVNDLKIVCTASCNLNNTPCACMFVICKIKAILTYFSLINYSGRTSR